jgi:hypothetical protein
MNKNMINLMQNQTIKNRFQGFLDKNKLSILQFCQETSVNRDIAEKLYYDSRYLPDSHTLELVLKAYSGSLSELVVYDPPSESLGELFPNLLNDSTEKLQITICGCGNLGHVFTGWLSSRSDLEIKVCVSTPEKAKILKQEMSHNGGITLHRQQEENITGYPNVVTADPAEAIPDSHLILLCLPSFLEADVLKKILPFVEEGTLIGSVPAPGGFNWTAQGVLEKAGKKAILFGMAAIPWMCKLKKYGQEVKVLGTKKINGQVTIPAHHSLIVSDLMSHLLKMPVLDLQNFLQITLNPGNQLLHPGISYALFRNWDGVPLYEPPLFYEEISEEAVDILQQMSNELMQLRFTLEEKMPNLNLSAVLPLEVSIQEGYTAAVRDRASLRSTIATNTAYAGLRTPMHQVEGGWIPNYESRFFQEDIPYGLVVLKGLAELAGVSTPTFDNIISWAQEKMGCEYLVDGNLRGKDIAESGAPQRFGWYQLNDLHGRI